MVLLRCYAPSYWTHVKVFEVYSCRWLRKPRRRINPFKMTTSATLAVHKDNLLPLGGTVCRIYWRLRLNSPFMGRLSVVVGG